LSEQDAPFELKIIDKRGQPKPEREAISPDHLADIKDTDDPMVKIACFPGNRVPEQPFKISRMEARGFSLLVKRAHGQAPPGGLGPDGQRAVHAARAKLLKLVQNAMRVHREAGQPPAGGVH
jgi:hypothetical protein